MLDLIETHAGAAAGFVAALCLVACPLLRGRGPMLLAQLGVGGFFAIHYGLGGLPAAAAVCVLGTLQTLAALFSTRMPLLDRVGYALIPAMVGLGLWFWTSPSSALAIAAMATIAWARMQKSEDDLRMLLLAGTLLWTAHDALVGSWVALSADIVTGLLGLLAIHRRQQTGLQGAAAF